MPVLTAVFGVRCCTPPCRHPRNRFSRVGFAAGQHLGPQCGVDRPAAACHRCYQCQLRSAAHAQAGGPVPQAEGPACIQHAFAGWVSGLVRAATVWFLVGMQLSAGASTTPEATPVTTTPLSPGSPDGGESSFAGTSFEDVTLQVRLDAPAGASPLTGGSLHSLIKWRASHSPLLLCRRPSGMFQPSGR